ncbi:MAG: M1 family metallopeptidase, partial [Planctomycetes bacterium]|nr:M1 family metallopeptidase [Planctomycetota bacterium]
MKKSFWIAFWVVVFVTGPLFGEENPFRAPADRSVDIQHLKLELEVFLSEKRIVGAEELSLRMRRPVRTLRLNAVDHEVQSVQVLEAGDERPRALPFDNTGTELVIDFGRLLPRGTACQLTIRYQVRAPRSGLHFFGPTEAEPDVPLMVWSQGEAESNRYWFPCLDHPNERQTTELIVTVPDGFEVVSNGVLVSRRKLPDQQKVRFHWKQTRPHVAYLVSLVVGKFAVGRDTWRGRPVLYYVPPERAADIERTFGRTVEMLEFFSRRFGIEYPWEKYAQVVVEQFVMGGMENTSATTLHYRVMHDERAIQDSSPDGLIAHELAHQWWGDLVTCKDWSHLWL